MSTSSVLRTVNRKLLKWTAYSFIVICSLPAHAQVSLHTQSRTGETSETIVPSGIVVATPIMGDSTLPPSTLDLNEDVTVIVQFKQPPLSLVKKPVGIGASINALPAALEVIKNEHAQFKADIGSVEQTGRSRTNSLYAPSQTRIVYEYMTVLNGVAVTTKRWAVEEFKKLSYVRRVDTDRQLHAFDDALNRLIGAPLVWANLGITGKGIKVGVIDTGIDYLHPDLGGGIGSGFKVRGGYDFINNDANPMDDNGHGTHVAGILAANGTSLKGVAPDAILYAFKVLGKDGSGPSSAIIAGIERAMDPDINPATNDGVQIINMSLGGPGDPDDPVSQATDNASAAGILCVIAAGNSGSYQTIGSPGCARTALTVGAVDTTDIIASFSSRGPSDIAFSVKPDVVAPGVSVVSDKLGGGYVSMSGTSMATPAVAGCAALLLQSHPEWTPLMVKSALMETAKNIGADIWTQGCGRIDVSKAIEATTLVTPASLSYGIDNLAQQIITRIDTLTIMNASTTSRLYQISSAGTAPAGMSISFSTATLNVPANHSGQVIVTMRIDNAVLPPATGNPAAYTGKIFVTSPGVSYAIPYAIVKSPALTLHFDDEMWVIYAVGQHSRTIWTKEYPGRNISLLLPVDTYDIIVLYGDPAYRILLNNVAVTNTQVLDITKSMAKNALSFRMKDERMQSITMNTKYDYYTHISTGFGLLLFGKIADPLYVNDMYGNFKYEWHGLNTQLPEKIYKFDGISKEIRNNITYQNDPATFSHRWFKFNVPPTRSDVLIFEEISRDHGALLGFGTVPAGGGALGFPFVQENYIQPLNSDDYEFKSFRKWTWDLKLSSPLLTLGAKDTLYFNFRGLPNTPALKTTASVLPLNFGPPHWYGMFTNTKQMIKIHAFEEGTLFFNQLQDNNSGPSFRSSDTIDYELYSGAQLQQKGSLTSFYAYSGDYSITKPAGLYKLLLKSPSKICVDGQSQKLSLEAGFDTRLNDPNPPTIKTLNITRDGQFTDYPTPAQTNIISFTVEDNAVLKTVALFYKPASDTAWRELPLVSNQGVYSTVFQPSATVGTMSLRIRATDLSDNYIDYSVEPAFRYCRENFPPSGFSLATPRYADTISLQNPPAPIRFTWKASTDPDRQDTLRYALRIIGNGFDTTIANIKDTVIDAGIMQYLQKSSIYLWSVIASDGDLTMGAESPFMFRTSSQMFPLPVVSLSAQKLDWNQTAKGTSVMLPLTVSNTSINDLLIDAIYTTSKQFVPGATTAIVARNAPYRLPVTFKADTFGVYNDTLFLHNNSMQPLVKIALHGESPLPVFAVRPAAFRHDTIAVGDSSLQSLVLKNASVNELPYEVAEMLNQNFRVCAAASGVIAANDSAVVPVLFTPKAYGESIDTLIIRSIGRETKIPLAGSSPAPKMTISAMSINFGVVKKDSTREHTLIIKNASINTLRIDSVKTGTRQFSIGAMKTPVFVSRTDSAILRTLFQPDSIKAFSDSMSIFTNQPSMVYILVRGNGTLTMAPLDGDRLPTAYCVEQNYPNPFNPSTTIQYSLPTASRVHLYVYNVLGQRVIDLVDADQPAGTYQAVWDAHVASGIYFYRLEAVSKTESVHTFVCIKKMLFVR